MDTLLGYIKNIGFFLILVSVVCNVLPDDGYKKYCRLFCGFVLVVLVITPFNEFLNYDGSIGDIFKGISNQSALMELEAQLKLQEEMEMENALEQYEEALKEELAGTAKEEGLYIMDVSVEYIYVGENNEDIQLSNISIDVTDDTSTHYTGDEGIHIDDIQINIEGESDIDKLSPGDRPKIIKFIEKVARLMDVDTELVSIKMYGET